MKTLFSIGTLPGKTDTLLLEIASDHCILAMGDIPGKHFQFLRYIDLEENTSIKDVQSMLEEMNVSADRILIGSAFEQAILVPQAFSHSRSLVGAVHDLAGEEVLHDTIPAWQMQTAYVIPFETEKLLKAKFPKADYVHHYTATLKALPSGSENQLNIHFFPRSFRVLMKKDNQVQLIQTYAYKTPLDVVYYLLKICYEMKMDQKEISVMVGGLIDQNSALYKELHHYFLDLEFDSKPEFSFASSDHPHYYFSSIFNLAACVS